MDVKDFSDPLFDAKDWVNKTLRIIQKDGASDTAVTSLMVKLQLYFQQINSELDVTSHTVMQNLPRVLHDIDHLAKEAATLKEKMSSVKEEIAKVEKNTGSSISSLEGIDKVKTELVNAKQALFEADNWTILSTDIEAVFETCDINMIASKLVSMQQSLNVLSTSVDFENKKIQLEGLKNRLEALASPFVVEAFTAKSVEQSKQFVTIFEEIGRLPLLIKYYSKCQKASLLHRWQTLIDLDTEENIMDSFQKYYEILLESWNEQIKWCEEVIPQISAVSILLELYTDLLTTLSNDFSNTLEKQMKQTFEPLIFLLQAKCCTQNFASSLKVKLNDMSIPENEVAKLVKAIYLPYVSHISKLGNYQKTALQQHLSNLRKDEGCLDLVELTQTLGEKNSKILSSATEAMKLCVDLTEGCGFPSFFQTIEWYFKSYLSLYAEVVTRIRDPKDTPHDFNMFQVCVTVLQNIGELLNSVKAFDQDCIRAALNCSQTLKKSEGNPFGAFSNLLLDLERQRQFTLLIESFAEENEPSALKSCYLMLERTCYEVYQTSFKVIFTPISTLLEAVPAAPAWKSKSVTADLPDYGFVPQEYITQIGQYLMNLPQLLEPFLSMDNPSLNVALSIVGVDYMHLVGEEAESSGFAEMFLGRIADHTCRAYVDHILGINSLGVTACKQLATDINYLGNVLEDLGFALSEKLKNINLLLKLPPAEYGSQCTSCSPQLVAAIRQMRNIITE